MSQRAKGKRIYLNAEEIELLKLMTWTGNYSFESGDEESDIRKENAAQSIQRKLRGIQE